MLQEPRCKQAFLNLLQEKQNLLISLSYQFKIIYLNSYAEQWLGLSNLMCQGKDFFDVLQAQNKTASFLSEDLTHICHDDYQWTLSDSGQGYFLTGLPVLSAIFKETAYKQIFLERLVENLPQYIFWKDVHSKYLCCNQNYAELVGLKFPREIVGKSDYDLPWQPDGDSADIFRRRDKSVLGGYPIVNVEQVLSLPGGKKVMVLINKVPIYEKKGKIIGVFAVSADITEQKEIEKELILAKEKAEIANKVKSEFIANMSHDFRTPLNAILGMSEAILLQGCKQKQKTFVEDIQQSGRILLRLIEDVLNISQLESDKYPLYLSTFNLDQLLSKTLHGFKEEAKKKGLKFYYKRNIANPNIYTDPDIIKRVVINLVTNALKFTESIFGLAIF